MIKPTGATFTLVDQGVEYTVNFMYLGYDPHEVCVIGDGIATRMNNSDRGYKPRVEDAKRAITDAMRKQVGLPRLGDAASRRAAKRPNLKIRRRDS